jgi:hypothetical protein
MTGSRDNGKFRSGDQAAHKLVARNWTKAVVLAAQQHCRDANGL